MTCEVMAVEHISVQANGMYQSMRRGYADIVRLGISMLRIGTLTNSRIKFLKLCLKFGKITD